MTNQMEDIMRSEMECRARRGEVSRDEVLAYVTATVAAIEEWEARRVERVVCEGEQ